jgi:hypothetical protein
MSHGESCIVQDCPECWAELDRREPAFAAEVHRLRTEVSHLTRKMEADEKFSAKQTKELAKAWDMVARLTKALEDVCPHTVWLDSLPGFCSACGICSDDPRLAGRFR